MKIIIFGDNITASTIAQSLVSDAHEITLVGQDTHKVKLLADTPHIQTVCGSYRLVDTYETAECHLANMLIVMTQHLETDMLITLMASSLYAIPKIITSLPPDLYEHRDNLMPTDKVTGSEHIWINTEQLAVDYLDNLTKHPGCQEIVILPQKQCIARIKITSQDANAHFKEMCHNNKIMNNIAIIRNHQVLEKKRTKTNDQIVFSCPLSKLDTLLPKINRSKRVENIMIAGLTTTSQALTKTLEANKSLKMIEKNTKKAKEFAQENANITVLEGDINDHALMLAEKIESTDAFLALSDDDEDNLVAALQAKRHGVSIVAALINRSEITPIIEDHDIHSIEPQKVLIDHIFQIIHRDLVLKKHTLHESAGIILTCLIPPQCDQYTLQKLSFPTSTLPCFLYRKKQYITVKHNTRLHSGDHLTLFTPENESVHQILKNLQQPSSLLDLFGLG